MQHILVTGASRGLGLEFTSQYLARGDRVFATCREPERAEGLRLLGVQFSARISIHRMNVADPGSIQAAHAAISRQTTQLDLILNNAGVYSSRGSHSPAESLGGLRAEDAILVFRTNTIGPILVAQEFLDLLSGSGQGRIVNLTSGYGSVSNNTSGYPYYYSASKAALNQLTRSLAADVRKRKIVAVVLDPGWVATDMGGKGAPLSPQESVASMIEVIEGLTMRDSGQFLDRGGKQEAW